MHKFVSAAAKPKLLPPVAANGQLSLPRSGYTSKPGVAFSVAQSRTPGNEQV